MNQDFDLQQQSICDDPHCPGLSSCKGCLAFQESVAIDKRITCPYKAPLCESDNLCDKCFDNKYPNNEKVQTRRGTVCGGSTYEAHDVIPLQGFLSDEKCDKCGKPVGSNPQTCVICASICESPLNPAQPPIHYDPHFGPAKGSFETCSDEITRITLEALEMSFRTSNRLNRLPISDITNKHRVNCIKSLISKKCFIGIEYYNDSSYMIVLFWMLSQGNMHNWVNTHILAGYILNQILFRLRNNLFVGRSIVEAFRLSLREYSLGEQVMDDLGLLISFLENAKIIKKGPMLSEAGCSFHINEVRCREPSNSIQDALCASMSSPLPFLENGSIISFQFFQQTEKGNLTHKTLGTNFEFPFDGVFVHGKLLRPRMFIIYQAQCFLVVLCVGESFFLTNILSASKCGHFLPETREISEEEAKVLFRTQAHTIVFECVGDVPQPQASCASDPLIPQSQPQVPCVSSGCVPSPPPPQVPGASGHWVPPPQQQVPSVQVAWALPPTPSSLLPVCGAQVAQHLPPPPPPQASSAHFAQALPPPPEVPPPPQQAPCAQVAQPHESPELITVNIEDVRHYLDQDGMSKWFVSIRHLTRGQITISGGYIESTNQKNVFLYTFDSNVSRETKLFKFEPRGECKTFINELNRRLNSSE
jgi:hypothetical protein